MAVPVLCYVFLDQIYIGTFAAFGHKWFARESQHLKEQSLFDLLKRYEEVLLSSDDLRGFGVARQGHVTDTFGQSRLLAAKPGVVIGEVSVARIGFLKYQTAIMVNPVDSTVVFFDFQDDTSVYDLIILSASMLAMVGIALLARRRMAILREKSIAFAIVQTMQGLAHDLRAPFGRLRIFMNQLQSLDSNAFTQLKDQREELDAATRQADDVLTDFLSLDAKPTPQPFDCQVIAARLEESYFRGWNQKHQRVALRFECQPDLLALGNEHKTLRILFNLLDNALKHAESFAHLSIHADGNSVWFRVLNDGPAIPKDQIASIFKPFYSRRKGGFGLGLFICDSFVKAQGSTLICESRDGSTLFRFALRRVASRTQTQAALQTKTSSGETTIAYVDDEAFYREALKSALAGSKIHVELFEDTDSLLLALKQDPTKFALLLVDRFGPHFDAVLDRLPESCRDYGYEGPIVLYSNSVTPEMKFDGFARALDKMKSLNADDILNIIDELKHETI